MMSIQFYYVSLIEDVFNV